ncbi:MAG: ATP-binding protein [Gemmatimonadaceae bacterium]
MRSISRRLLIGQTVAVGISAALTVALLVGYEARAARASMERELSQSVSAFATLMEPALWDLDFERASRLASAFGRDPRIGRLTVAERSSGTTKTFTVGSVTDTVVRRMEVRHGTQAIGDVSVAFDRGYYREQISRQLVTAIVVSLIALAATLIALFVLLRRVLRSPLDKLSHVVREYATGRDPGFHDAVPYSEFAEFGNVLDSMSAQLRAQFAALRTANRELTALNRFLLMASADVEPSGLVAEAARELRELFDATRAHAELDTEHGTAEVAYEYGASDGEDADVETVTVPILDNAHPIGTITLARAKRAPFTQTEIGIASAVAAQLAAAISRSRARASERLLRAAIEQLPESIIITNRDQRIVYVNPGFSETTGYTADEAMGRDPRDLKRVSRDDAAGAGLSAALEGGTPWVGRLTNAKKSGEIFFEEVMVTPVRNDRGDVAHHVAIGRDITIEMRRDEQYRHAQRMEAVGQLAGGIAHDFNNMLGAVLLQLELLELEEELTQPVQHALQEMRATLERTANLTRQLLTLSRRQAMRVAVHDLNTITNEMLSILRRVIGEGIAIDFAPAPRPVSFEGDAGMIEQVIVNLCVNARDAMPAGGRLGITSRLVTLGMGTEHPGTWASVEVRDTGSGMTPEVQARIFEPFFTTKEVGRGTGLGLATTHGIVAQHGGWIDVQSVVGEGTTFTVYLPARADAPAAAIEAPAKDAARGDATVLLVEDEPLVRQTVAYSLQRLGHTVIEATSGPDALQCWSERGDDIDLVITDMVMPGGVSGLQLVERMRVTHPQLRAIVMSGYSLQLSSDGLPAGIALLPKPFSLAALGEAIGHALGLEPGATGHRME